MFMHVSVPLLVAFILRVCMRAVSVPQNWCTVFGVPVHSKRQLCPYRLFVLAASQAPSARGEADRHGLQGLGVCKLSGSTGFRGRLWFAGLAASGPCSRRCRSRRKGLLEGWRVQATLPETKPQDRKGLTCIHAVYSCLYFSFQTELLIRDSGLQRITPNVPPPSHLV